jgi:hypothetical protein
MERVGKGSVGMLTGQAEPTIIQPSQYRKRFTLAMERYFMTVPDKWIAYDRQSVPAGAQSYSHTNQQQLATSSTSQGYHEGSTKNSNTSFVN